MQAFVENLRHLLAYPYPVHAWRLVAVWLLSAAFSVLLASYAAGRFLPKMRGRLTILALVGVGAASLAPGFDWKTSIALLVGVVLAGAAASAGVWTRQSAARSMLAYLALFLALAVSLPEWLVDVSFFLLAAALVLPLLAAEVVRLAQEDRGREAALVSAASQPDRLTIATARGVEFVPLRNIVSAVGADDYVELRLVGGRTVLHAERLDRLAAQLPSNFLRVHRSAIANLAYAHRLEREGRRWRLYLADENELSVSQSRLPKLREVLDGAAGERLDTSDGGFRHVSQRRLLARNSLSHSAATPLQRERWRSQAIRRAAERSARRPCRSWLRRARSPRRQRSSHPMRWRSALERDHQRTARSSPR